MRPFCSGLFWLHHAHVPTFSCIFAFQYRRTWERGSLIIFLVDSHCHGMCVILISFHFLSLQSGKFTTLDAILEDATYNSRVLEKCVQCEQWKHVCDMKGMHSTEQAVRGCVWYAFKSVIETTNVCDVRVGHISIIRSAFESNCHQDLLWPQRSFCNSLRMCRKLYLLMFTLWTVASSPGSPRTQMYSKQWKAGRGLHRANCMVQVVGVASHG